MSGWEDGDAERLFTRASVSRWAVPIDDTHTVIFGVRHFNRSVDPKGRGNDAEVGEDVIDFVGQTGNRPYAERQRDPGDWDAQVSQRPVAVHALEHRGQTDKGVIMLRRALRDRIRAIAREEDSYILTFLTTVARSGPIPTIRSCGRPERRAATTVGACASLRTGSPTSSPGSTSSKSPSVRSGSKGSWRDCRRVRKIEGLRSNRMYSFRG